MKNIDFLEQLQKQINNIEKLPINCTLNYLSTDEALLLYPLAGSRIIQGYYDGISERQVNAEFAMKSKDQQKIYDTLWLLQGYLDNQPQIQSDDGSFELGEMAIVNQPRITQSEGDEWYTFLLDIQVKMTVFNTKEENKNGKN